MHQIIFDTAAVSESLLYNVRKLGLDLSRLEYIVLSHGHKDHTATTVELSKMARREVKVVAHPHLFLPKFTVGKDGKRVEGGPPKGEKLPDIQKAGARVLTTKKPLTLVPGLCTTGEIPRITNFEKISPPARDATAKRFTVIEGEIVPDILLDDQALIANVKSLGTIVITGCSHAGVVNTVCQAQKLSGSRKIYGAIGGFHLLQRENSYIKRTVQELKKLGLELVSPCHCTGFKAASILYQTFPRAFALNFSGRTIQLGRKPEPQLV